MERIHRRPNLRSASVTMSLPDCELEVAVSADPKLWHMAWPLVEAPWPRFFREVSRAVHHFEVYQPDNRKRGFVLRVVRRGITDAGSPPFYDLAEFFLRIPADPPTVNRFGIPIPIGDPMTPKRLGDLLSHAADACIVACSALIDFTGLRLGTTVIHRGSRLPMRNPQPRSRTIN